MAVQPLAPARYKISFTAGAELYGKLNRLRALMRASVPDGDLAAIIEEAVTEKLERLESKRFGKTSAPRKSLAEADTSPDSRYIPSPIRRAVCERDSDQCDAQGRRCTARDGLEFHHRAPYRRDGDHSVENLCLMCHAHNAYLAELDFGKDVMDRYRRNGSLVCEEPPDYVAHTSLFHIRAVTTTQHEFVPRVMASPRRRLRRDGTIPPIGHSIQTPAS